MKDFTNKSEKELAKLLVEKKKALQTFRFNITGSKIKNMKEARGLRKEVARIKTAQNMK